jgi:hypothetical protein
MKLYEIAMARSGDKTDTSNVAVWPNEDADWPLLREQLTIERVRERFGSLVKGEITRYEYPQLHVLNFVMTEALRGGVGMGMTLDPHGKAYQTLILEMDIDPDATT